MCCSRLSQQVSFWGAPTHADIMNFQTSCCNLKIIGLGAKLFFFSYYFSFERNYDTLKSKKESMHFVEQKYKL